jgi:membrane protein DedA with SNARE-associated domain
MPYRHLFAFLIKYKYEVIFPIAILEGPIITIISRILVSLGYLSFFPALAVVFLGDMISDSGLYALGHFGRNIAAKFPFFTKSERHIERLESHYQTHPFRTIAVSKVSYGLGTFFLIAAGGAKLGYRKFMRYATPLNAVKSAALLTVGYYFGRVAVRASRHYLPYYALAIIIVVPLSYYLGHLLKQRKLSRANPSVTS